jgi:hypothetical protein
MERFWSKVDKNGPVPACNPGLGNCWQWLAGKDTRGGYGEFAVRRGEVVRTHKFLYEILMGVVPKELVLDHLCRNRSCVNPWHLEPVTQKVNVLRGESPCSINSKKTHCKNGHRFSEENTYVQPSRLNGRSCRVCRKNLWESWAEKNRV